MLHLYDEQLLRQHFTVILDHLFPTGDRDPEMHEHLRGTPRRLAKAWAEMFTANEPELTCFDARNRKELVVEVGIPFHSVCAHHFLPFYGKAVIGYIPDEKIVGLSKLARVLDYFAARPQTQERLAGDIADYLMNHKELKPAAVGVILVAEHMCMSMRGVEKHGVATKTSALRGSLREDAAQRAEFMLLGAGLHGGVE